jgi:ribonuclease HIII
LRPAKYNELYRKFGNLNRLLAWGHARVLENLLEQVPDCPRALSDKFAHESLLRRALGERGQKVELEQRTKAESDPAVAAASILAREQLIDWLDQAAEEAGESLPFPRGASAQVKARADVLLQRHGPASLPQWIKMHFKTAHEVLSGSRPKDSTTVSPDGHE